MAEIGIIIVSHNGLQETTAPCLESIFSIGGRSDFEVVVVDNNSSDETPDYLRLLMKREKRLRCIFNTSNRGFAGGNNDGLRATSAPIVILLNSDCIVTHNWMEDLTAPLLLDPTIGLTGPVSNSVGNEQKIFTCGASRQKIIEEGVSWVSNSRDGRFETQMLSFFCVAMRRSVFDDVGPLDEAFGLGFYEDDDYCMRVRLAGYKLVCVEDVFIYHRGGGSFDRLPQGTRKLMKENRRKLETKHCPRRRTHPRDLQMLVLEGYLRHASQDGLSPQLHFRASNRFREIESRMPRGIWKKWAFRRRLSRLRRLFRQYGYES
ncbi:MAG: glycosyltransferase family 2 protein [Syntrophobacteraceae bacterium]